MIPFRFPTWLSLRIDQAPLDGWQLSSLALFGFRLVAWPEAVD